VVLKPDGTPVDGENASEKGQKGLIDVKCPRCRSRQLVTIEMTVAGEHLVLNSCSACDVRWWEGDGQRLGLSDVLELASIPRH
jgi:phage FluMu protein Com